MVADPNKLLAQRTMAAVNRKKKPQVFDIGRKKKPASAQRAQIQAVHDWQHPKVPGMRGIGGVPQGSPVTSVRAANKKVPKGMG